MNVSLTRGHDDPIAFAALPEALTLGLSPGPMDWALARALNARVAARDPRQLALVAVTSAAWRAGHACIQVAEPALAALCADMPWTASGGDPAAAAPLVWQAPRLYLHRAWQAEQTIRAALSPRLRMAPWPDPAHLAELESACWPDPGNPAEATQRQAARAALTQSFTLITGGPGTGKTHVVARLLAMRQAQALRQLGRPLRIGLAAPTGKAAARLAQSLGDSLAQLGPRLPAACLDAIPRAATTLHRTLLGASPTQPLEQDLWVVDEASMIDLELMAQWLSCLAPHAALVLLGDPDQLASVEAGAVLAQLCESPQWATHRVHLSHSHRFDPQAGIGQWARLTQQGDAKALQTAWAELTEIDAPTEARVRRCASPLNRPESVAQWLRTGWQAWLEWFEPLRSGTQACTDDQALAGLRAHSALGVLCASHQGSRGVDALNEWVSQLLSLPAADATGWQMGRPVMVLRNLPHLGLMNGDVGLCLPRLVEGRLQARVAFARSATDGSPVTWVPPSMVHPVQTAWALTVHKSQGSEFDRVMVVVPQHDSPLMTREWLYTALTRARESVAIWSSTPEVWLAAVQRPTLRLGGLG